MYYIVYKTTNLLNNKEYIGIHQTKDLNDGYLGSGKHLKHAVIKYGPENFKKEILHYCSSYEEMLAKEAELVSEEWCSWSNTYNICVGGFGGGFKYINSNKLNATPRRSDAARINLQRAQNKRKWLLENDHDWWDRCKGRTSESLKRKYETETHHWAGRPHTEESKALMRGHQRQTGSKNSSYGTRWITDGNQNRKIKVDDIPDGWYRGRTVKKF